MTEGSLTATQLTQVPAMAPSLLSSLTDEERVQVEQCQKILQFRDRVLSGLHPTIKVPSHLFAPKDSSKSRGQPSANGIQSVKGKSPPKGPKLSRANATMPSNGTGSKVAANLRSFGLNATHSAPVKHAAAVQAPGFESSSGPLGSMTGIPTGPRADAGKIPSDSSAAAQFDPVLLTKSEDLIKAEFQLGRQRLERSLAEQLQQQRAATKAANTIEAPVDFDLAAVLMKALQLAQSSALPQTDASLAANHSGTESDSNATFYSSKHDTPESHLEQRIPASDEAEVVQEREDSPYEPPMVMDASSIPSHAPVVAIPASTIANPFSAAIVTASQQQTSNPFAQPPNPFMQPPAPFANAHTNKDRPTQASVQRSDSRLEGHNAEQEANGVPMEINSSQESGEGSGSRNSVVEAGGQQSTQIQVESATRQMIEQAFGRHQAPILRAHNLSPIAPQPAHVSPLATSRQPPIPQQDAPPAQATSAQIVALRADHSNGSSPDSSPQGKAGRKAKKNKKRKADRMAANNASLPYIKPEPRSPSPMAAPHYSRQANKRIRSAQHQRQEQAAADGPRFEEVVESAHSSTYPPRLYREDRGPASPALQPAGHDTRAVIIPEVSRHEREYRDEFRPVETVRYIRRSSPGVQQYSYPPTEVRTYRSVSRAAVDRPYPHYDRDPRRSVIRPADERERSRSPILTEERAASAMGPPQLPASRVFIDEFGREYIEPPSRQEPVVIRRSIAPRPVYGDHEEVYDPPRVTSRIIRRSVAPATVHGEPEIVYERAPPARAASVMPGPSRYGEELVYRTPASPAGYSPAGFTTTRRVVTRPEYAPEYRYYRERDYPSQPPSQPVGEYYEIRDSRPPREGPQQIVRYTTVRPESPARPDVVRMSSVRPEPVPVEYGAPNHPNAQAMPPPRSYSVRPMAPPPPPQQGQYIRQWPEYEARPEYEVRPAYTEQVRGEDEGVTFVDSAPREVYR